MPRPADSRAPAPTGLRGEPRLSVIVPALNEARHVANAVESARCDGAEIIVVDGGSADDTVALARRAGARVVAADPGRARQMNRGAELAKSPALVFLHADTVLPAGYADLVLDALGDPNVSGGAFEHETDLRTRGMLLIEKLIHFRAKYLQLPYGDQAIFVRRSTFAELGGFPDVSLAEDLLFVRRLRQRGRIAIVPARAITSGRRWRQLGIVKTTAVNQLIVAACLLGIPHERFGAMYRRLGRLARGGDS